LSKGRKLDFYNLFLFRIEKALENIDETLYLRKHTLDFKYSTKESQNIVNNFFQPSYYTSNDKQQGKFEDISPEAKSKVFTRKCCVVLMS